MNTIKAVIVDDEPDSVETLKLMLGAYPQVTVVGSFTRSDIALKEIKTLAPDLLFTDIEMPVLNGFELLEQLKPINFQIVFVTAYNQFALKAFRFNALDYLVKPIIENELSLVIDKAQKKELVNDEQLQNLKKQLKEGHITKIAIPDQTGITFIDIKDIVFVEASGNYSSLVFKDKKKILVTRNLKDIQDVLEVQHFLRIHRQFIINLNLVKSFNRNDNTLTMSTGDTMPVARSQKQNLIEQFGWL